MTKQLDYETVKVHYLPVVIHDGGVLGAPDGLSATATLTVSVVNVDEAHTALNIPAVKYIATTNYPIGTTVCIL